MKIKFICGESWGKTLSGCALSFHSTQDWYKKTKAWVGEPLIQSYPNNKEMHVPGDLILQDTWHLPRTRTSYCSETDTGYRI